MKKVIAILLCMGVIMSFAGCDSSIVEELNPFEQITSEKESKYEVLDQEGYIVPNCYVTIWDLELYPQALQKDMLTIGYTIRNESESPINASDIMCLSVKQDGNELELVDNPTWSFPFDILIQPQEEASAIESYYVDNRNDYIEIEFISLDKNSPVIISTYYDVYSGVASYMPLQTLRPATADSSTLLFARFGRFDENDTDCLVDVANEWFDAIDLIPEGCGGGLLTHFYSHNEHELGGEGLLFSIGIFEQEYDYSWKPWASQAKRLTTYTDSTGSKYDLILILPDSEMEIKDSEAYDALNAKTEDVIDSLRLESYD